jgi:hypothetical protein
VATAHEQGWATLTNGELLAAAESAFDVFVTTDQNLGYQQNLSDKRLAILLAAVRKRGILTALSTCG